MREIILTKKIKSGTIIRAIGLLLFFVTVFAKANAMRAAPAFFTGHQLVFANGFWTTAIAWNAVGLGRKTRIFRETKIFLRMKNTFQSDA